MLAWLSGCVKIVLDLESSDYLVGLLRQAKSFCNRVYVYCCADSLEGQPTNKMTLCISRKSTICNVKYKARVET